MAFVPDRRCLFLFLYILLNVCGSFKIENVNYLGQRWELYNRIEKEVGTVKCNRVNKNGKTTSTTL